MPPMLSNITREKVKEVIRLAERVQATPDERASDPHRGRGDARGVTAPETPQEPQPASDWPAAFQRFLIDLPEPALDELLALYRYGRGDARSFAAGLATVRGDRSPHADRVRFIVARADVVRSLEAALRQLP
jgi:hypothetical protein